ncbi:MAG: hypothetical protein FJ219_05610 [Ignavibacteria bacterium]|nr:hypothetical protein [Ignavibacteria bacterium]
MINQENTQHIASLLDTLPSLQEGYVSLHIEEYADILHDVITLALSSELQLFSSHYAEWVFLTQKYPQYARATSLYKRFFSLIYSTHASQYAEELRILCRLILMILSDQSIDSHCIKIEHSDEIPQSSMLLKGIIQSWQTDDKHLELHCRNNEQDEITICIAHEHASFTTVWEGAILHINNCIMNGSYSYHSTDQSLCILEPDLLHTATDIAECTTNGDHVSIGSMFIRKFSKKQSGIPLLVGIILGTWLDKALAGDDSTIESIAYATLQSMPLQALNAIRNQEDMENLIAMCSKLQEALEPILDTFDAPIISTEAAFLAPIYGLIGRLDILMEYDDPLEKTVIELKSGNAPSAELPVHFSEISLPMGAWKSHVIQVACYNLLLDAAFPGRTGDSRLLYPKDPMHPMRNVLNNHIAKREAMRIRNAIVTLEHDIIHRKFGSFLRLFGDEELPEMTTFTRDEVMLFKNHFEQLDNISKLYILATLSFIMREQHSARMGSSTSTGLSSLWQYSIQEKQQKLLAIGYLKLDIDMSDFEVFHLHLQFTEQTQSTSSLRSGDIVLLYPHAALSVSGQILGHVHKASIRSINQDGIIISLRNKVARIEQFTDTDCMWCIESDGGTESLHTGLLRSLGEVIRSTPEQRNRILGIQRPRVGQPYHGTFPDFLHSTQKDLLSKILSTKDYFLLQGPPGTGKTSAIIRSLIECLMNDDAEHIMLCAFTNRAVDELCAVVDALKFPFIRLGSKHGTLFFQHSLQHLAETKRLEEVRESLQSNRIIISTVSTLHTHAEIHDWFSTTTMIIDEASQLLEPQVSGILMHADRFILIGDERQLPAVIMQDIRWTILNNPLFDEICLIDFRISLFERLLKLCMKNGDHHAYGMLTIQARMHDDIANIVSSMHYGNRLQSMNPWQHEHGDIPLVEFPRLAWIDSLPEQHYKLHLWEADKAVALACTALQEGRTKSVGIISPFRSQNALIQSKIPSDVIEFITVDTVERFQGSERELIIISLAIHNEFHMKGIESLAEIEAEIMDRKLNVALTRAKKQCIILGCPTALRKGSPYAMLRETLTNQVH